MRRFLATLLTVTLLALAAPVPPVQAAEEPQISDIGVQVEGRKLEVIVINVAGRTLVPLRAVGDVLGASVGWDQATRTATLTLNDRTVRLQIGSTAATVVQSGQSRSVALDAPAVLFQDRTYVPARFVAEGLGYQVAFDAQKRLVTITDPTPTPGGDRVPGGGALPAWRAYDLTGDGRVDSADARALWADGPGATARDLNGDGKRNSLDMWDMLMQLTQWDRNADMAISAADFETPAPIALPEPDPGAADALARALLTEAEGKMPADLRTKLAAEWAPLGAVTAAQKGALWEEAGITALFIGNLEAAQWAFANSYQESPDRDSALANLGYVMAESGRYSEAMLLYARAREMSPNACTTNSNIAWVFSRHNQLDEAIAFHQKAVEHCPYFAQYHLNLGAVYLRAGRRAEAEREFAEAAELNPDDDQAFIIAVASNPAEPKPAKEYEREYLERQEEWVRIAVEDGTMEPEDAANAIIPWDDLGVYYKWEEIRQSIADREWARLQEQLDALAERTSDSLRAEAERALPQGASACEDLQRWAQYAIPTAERMRDIVLAARMEADQMATAADRKMAATELSLDNMLLEMALAEAQEAMLQHRDDISAKEAFEQSLQENYFEPMAQAEKRLREAHAHGSLDIPDERALFDAVLLGGLLLPMSSLDPEYADWDHCGQLNRQAPSGWEFKEAEDSFAIGLAIVEIEYKPDSGEIKLQVGQGVMVAGTWSPKSGFGVQAGVGIDFDWGPLSAGGATWVKRGSDGSITLEVEGGGGLGGGGKTKAGGDWDIGTKWQGSATKTLRAATNEPIGAIE